ncbi:hypothetical protein BH24ACT22_BH24ACT22_16310 [soil metagenome]
MCVFGQTGPGALQSYVMLRSIHSLVLVVILVALFGAFYPVLDAAGLCGSGKCPEMVESSSGGHAGFSLTCIAVFIPGGGGAMFALAAISLRRRSADHSMPHELYLTPEPPPPKALLYG